jgi:hypothetical protein
MSKKIILTIVILIVVGLIAYIASISMEPTLPSSNKTEQTGTNKQKQTGNDAKEQPTQPYKPTYDNSRVQVFENKEGEQAKTDTDKDGIPDENEKIYKTDPNKADTDDDGVNDFDEIRLTLNPFSDDSDGDGIKDGDEIKNQTDPKDPASK